ncbi:MAG TPA: hypothetical protein VFB58_10670 [Chloroflexota bacterium]|nr:hypothetical protein [Chloroflexota bacterium]
MLTITIIAPPGPEYGVGLVNTGLTPARGKDPCSKCQVVGSTPHAYSYSCIRGLSWLGVSRSGTEAGVDLSGIVSMCGVGGVTNNGAACQAAANIVFFFLA